MPVEKIEEGSQSVPYNTETGEDVVLQPQPQRPAGANDIYERGYAEGYAKGFEDGRMSLPESTSKNSEELVLWKVKCFECEELVIAKTVAEAISKYIGRYSNQETEREIESVTKLNVIY